MKDLKKKMLGIITVVLAIITAVLAMVILFRECNKKTIAMTDVVNATTLEAEPMNWCSDESISILLQTQLPAELQRTYMELIGENHKKIFMEDPEGWLYAINANENGIYVGNEPNSSKFFKSASGNVVNVSKVFRTLYRSEYFEGESQKAYDSIELDNYSANANWINIAVTDDFSIMYNTVDNTYQCIKYGNVIGTSKATNIDAVINPTELPKHYGGNKGFVYNKEVYIPMIEKKGNATNFYIVKQSEFDAREASFSYVDMKIGNLEVKACEIVQ